MFLTVVTNGIMLQIYNTHAYYKFELFTGSKHRLIITFSFKSMEENFVQVITKDNLVGIAHLGSFKNSERFGFKVEF